MLLEKIVEMSSHAGQRHINRDVHTETYGRKGAEHFDPVLRRERVRRIHGGEVGQAGRGVCRGPAQDVTQLRRVGVDGVPRHQELKKKKKD